MSKPSTKKKPKRPKQQSNKGKISAVIHLPEATDAYFRSLCEPSVVRNVGIPDMDTQSFSTLKTHAFARGSMTIGTTGFGFVAMSPGLLVANDANSVIYSTSAYSSNSIGVVGPGVLAAKSNSQFATAAIGNDPLMRWRVVSAELKVRYNGSQLNLGGTVHALQEPAHQDLFAYTTTMIDAVVQSQRYPVDREWVNVLYCPMTTTFQTNLAPGAYTNTSMGVLVQSLPGNTFDWEACLNFEAFGDNVRGQTHCVVDTVGFGAARAAMAAMGGTYKGNSGKAVHKTFMERVKEYIVTGTTWIGQKGLPFLETVVEHAPAILATVAALV